jgi:hypothetical protein
MWNLYHLTFEEGIDYEKAFSIDLSDEAQFESSAERLALLHSQSIRKEEHEAFWERNVAMNAESVGRVLFDEQVLAVIRREIHRSKDVLIDIEDLALAIHDLLSIEAREKIGPPKIRHRIRRGRTKGGSAEAAPAEVAEIHLVPVAVPLPGWEAQRQEEPALDVADWNPPARRSNCG